MNTRLILTIVLGFCLRSVPAVAAVDDSLADRIADLERMEGFFDLYWEADSGKLLLKADRVGEPFIYQASLARGVGSNDLGLDRGQLGSTALVEFQRFGPRLLLIEQNLDYRATSDSPAEQAAVTASFARSVLWGFDIEASDGDTVLIDATAFFLRDAHGVATTLSRAQQGQFSVDESRSAIFLPRTRSFPDNTEIEAVVTYTGQRLFNADGSAASDLLPTVVPDPTAITVHLHHSFVRLPEPGYEPLAYDPRDGLVPARTFLDYASAIGEPLRVTYARRHRLQREDPTTERGPAKAPIVYHVDPGVPEPIRTALIEGARWWNQAFTAAGYEDAFQVQMLPDDADPMDVRYNVIQWVHRSTRGWSYGSSVYDPRTGEIIKGHVTLGSLRVRQDYLIAEGLLAPYSGAQLDRALLEMSLARIRQLSAHEVGHTIGLAHNFAASANDRASVMDYPFPLIRFDGQGGLDLSDAYTEGIGEWDKRTVDYAYRDFPAGVDTTIERRKILERTIADGYHFVADSDARDPGTAHPLGNLWDNGEDAVEEFNHLLAVRAHALARFGAANIRAGRPMATMEEALVPIYLLHRYQIQAVGKLIGGQYFTYQLRGDGQPAPIPVAVQRQQQALHTLLDAIDPAQLLLPADLASRIPPRPPGFPQDRESFSRSTGVVFDPLAPARSAVRLTLDVLLHPQRAARMNAQHATDREQPSFKLTLEAMLDATWRADHQAGISGVIQRDTAIQVLTRLMGLAADPAATAQVRAQALEAMTAVQAVSAAQAVSGLGRKQRRSVEDEDWSAHYAMAVHLVQQFREDPVRFAPAPPPTAPPGSPIGD